MAEHDATAETTVTTHQRDLGQVGRSLEGWLTETLHADGPVKITELRTPSGSGMSSVTILFRAAWSVGGQAHERDLVARLAPDDDSFPVFPTYDFRLQYDVMAAMAAHSTVPVPVLVGIEESGSLLGSPMIVMEAVHGRAPSDNPPYVFGGWLYDATPAERQRVQDATAEVIARVHEVPVSAVPSFREAGPDALRRHFQGQRDFYAWSYADDGVRVPVIERAFAWLEANWPADPGDPVLCWGDARPGNILFDGFEPAAVLDWEMATVAPRGLDVAWFPLIHGFFQDVAEVFELPGLPDFGDAEEFAAAYERHSGHPVKDLHWYLVYNALRYGIVMARVRRRQVHFGEEERPADPDDYTMNRGQLERLLAQ